MEKAEVGVMNNSAAVVPSAPMLVALTPASGTSIDAELAAMAMTLTAAGRRLRGIVRADDGLGGDDRGGQAVHCDLRLRDIASGDVFSVEQDLGCGAAGCRLDDGALDAAAARLEASLDADTDLLVLNKFGKQEAEGRGLRGALIKAVDLGIPVVIGVPNQRLEAWRAFAGDAAVTFDPADPAFEAWLANLLPGLKV